MKAFLFWRVMISQRQVERPKVIARRMRRISVAFMGSIVMAMSVLLPTALATAANPSEGFDPGNIITDARFYDGNAMTANEVQEFLNSQVSRCTIGDSGRVAGSAWGNTTIASMCVQNLRMTTQSRAANAFCAAYPGAASETGAQIVAKVGKACGISQKALLVMLQKEQSLISDSWPTVTQLDWAMGYACPDTAACDSQYRGFFNQVYKAAWQLKVYQAYPGSYRYQAGRTNSIYWHPNSGCGASSVFIENNATAGLYTYTPYRPNQAALQAGWGTGDACSSYGNRNFYNYYRAWFGSPTNLPEVRDGIKVIWDRARAEGFDYGDPLEERQWVSANGGGWQQVFRNGVITESRALYRTFGLPAGKFSEAYLAQGGANGSWGFLAGDARGDTHLGDRAVDTTNGTLIYTLARGVQYVPSDIYEVWVQSGGHAGPLKYPVGNANQPSRDAASQLFENGSTIMTSAGAGTVVSASQVAEWNALGGYPKIGFYTSDLIQTGSRGFREAELGTLFFSNDAPLFIGNGKLLDAYAQTGGPDGIWGWPLGEEIARDGGVSSIDFENGIAVHSPTFGIDLLKRDATGNPLPKIVDIENTLFESEILWMSDEGISSGYPIEFGAAEFRSWNTVTRDAMAAFLYRSAGSPVFVAPESSPFVDVSTSHQFYKEIAWLSAAGISTGWETSNGREFRPGQPVARDAMAAFLYRAEGSPAFTAPTVSPFSDVPTSHQFYQSIAWLSANGISNGWITPDGRREFRPVQSIARDAMAAFIYRSSR